MSAGISENQVQEALQRAKEHAAIDSSSNSSLKRSIDDDFDQNPAKRAHIQAMDGSGLAQMGAAYMQMANPTDNVVEVIQVPNDTVGLIIGRNGTEISTIQNSSGCRVQMSQESECDPGSNTRQCTLQGTKMSVERAKQLINEVIARANQRQNNMQSFTPSAGDSRQITTEMLIPAAKCGLVIGKQGDTIKQLQEQAGCRMHMIQDSQEVTGQPKPLRITGDPDKVENAKRLVTELLNSRDDGPGGVGGGGMGMQRQQHHYGGGGGHDTAKGEVVVPRASVGMIIGKGGETIKRVAMETGTKIQFKPDVDPSSAERCAVIMGTREQIYKATELITELVHKSCNGGSGGGASGPGTTGGATEFFMHVPANKTGLVIGKGGETIKQINAESGAHCELSRDPPPNAQEKVFIIKGTAYQIHHAQHIIRIKVGDIPPGTPVPPFAGAGPQMGNGFSTAQYGGAQYGMPQTQWSAGFGQQTADPANAWGQQQAHAYYAGGAPAAAYQAPQYQQAAAAQAYATPTAQPAAQTTPTSSAPSINPQTGQPDYSAQWAEYYRQMGMHEQAAIIENQMKQTQGRPQVPGGAAQPAVSAASAGTTPGYTPGQQYPAGAAVPAAAPTVTAAAVGNSQYPGYAGGQPQQFPQTGQYAAQPQQF